MTLPEIKDPTDQEIYGWITHAAALGTSWSSRADILVSARSNLGPVGMPKMLREMKLETAEDVVEWLAGK